MTHRFFVEALLPEGGSIELGEDETKHASVLRLSLGDEVLLFDGQGHEARARIVEAGARRVACKAEPRAQIVEPGPRVTLLQSMAKADKLELIVRMTTELGVAAVELVDTEHSVAKLDDRRAATKTERLQKIAREAARQSGRATIPGVFGPDPLIAAARRAPSDALRIFFWERSTRPLAEVRGRAPLPESVVVLVGPEGGFSEAEAAALSREGFVDASLGPTILRVETAAVSATALVREQFRGHPKVKRLTALASMVNTEAPFEGQPA